MENLSLYNKTYTYEDYLKFDGDKKIELISGLMYAMAPSPSVFHQSIAGMLYRSICNYIERKKGKCKTFIAPLDVVLDDNNVVQPDVFVVCDSNKITGNNCSGTPDLVAEVVSPSSRSMDYVKKLNLYEKFGVKEYWIINPMSKSVMVYVLSNNEYGEPKIYDEHNNIKISMFEDFEINLHQLFSM